MENIYMDIEKKTAVEQVTRFIDEKIGGLSAQVELDKRLLQENEASLRRMEMQMQELQAGMLARKRHMQELQSDIYELEKLKEKISK